MKCMSVLHLFAVSVLGYFNTVVLNLGPLGNVKMIAWPFQGTHHMLPSLGKPDRMGGGGGYYEDSFVKRG